MPATKPAKVGSLYVRPVPATTKSYLKAECVKREISIQDAVILFMRHSAVAIPFLKKHEARGGNPVTIAECKTAAGAA